MFFFESPQKKYDRFIQSHYSFQKAVGLEEMCEAQYRKWPTKKNKSLSKSAKEATLKAGREKYLKEKNFINIDAGLYVGLGVNLKTLKEIEPIYLPWGNLDNHMGYLGTTRYGKTRALASLLQQIILKGDHVIFWDPKQGANEVLSWALQYAYEAKRLKDMAYYSPLFPEMSQLSNILYGMGDEEIVSMISNIQHPNPLPTGNEVFYRGFLEKSLMGELRGLSYLEKALDPFGHGVRYRLKEEIKNYYKMTTLRGKEFREYDSINNILYPDPIERLESYSDSDYVEPSTMLFNRTFITFKELFYYSDFSRIEDIYNSVKTTPIPIGISDELRSELEMLRGDAELLLSGVIAKGTDYYETVSEGYRGLLSTLATGRIGKSFCTVRINPLKERIISDKGLIAVVNPNPLKFQRTSEVITKMYMKMFESIFGTISSSGRPNKRRIWFIIDEGEAALAPGIQVALNKMGGLGMTLVIATQSNADFEYKLGPTLARVARDSINTWFYMKPNDNTSKIDILESLGTVKAFKSTLMFSAGSFDARSTVQSENQDVTTTTKIDELKKGQAFLKHYGDRYKIIFPYVPNPGDGKFVLKMPLLDEEKLSQMEAGIESAILASMHAREYERKEEAESKRADNNLLIKEGTNDVQAI